MATGFDVVRDGVTVTLEPQGEDGFAIVLSRNGHTVRSLEGDAVLEDPAALAKVIEGMRADLSSAEHQTTG